MREPAYLNPRERRATRATRSRGWLSEGYSASVYVRRRARGLASQVATSHGTDARYARFFCGGEREERNLPAAALPNHTAPHIVRTMARGGKPSSTRPSSAGAKKKRQGGHEEWMDDEVDAHHRGRDKISLDPDDDDEDSEDDFDDAADAVMDLDDDSDDEEDSDDSDDDDDDEDEEEKDDEDAAADDGDAYDSQEDEEDAALIRAMKAQQKKLNASGITRAKKDDDESESESESESDGPGIRGKKKSDFYGDDREVDHEGLEDEEDREEEEKEARRMQRSLAEGMDAADYGLSESESESESASEEKTLGAKAKKLASSGKKTKTGEAAAKDDKKRAKRAKKKPKSDGKDADAAAAVIEALGEDDAHGAGAAATDAVTADAPEIMALQRELAKNLEEVKNVVEPALQVAKKGGYATELGISYLETKHMLMLSYCVNIVMYLLLKSEGVAVKDHPVVVRLVEIRTYLEKLRPIDRKLKYQIEKLLKLASEQNEREELGDGDGGGGGDAGEDPLAFRPNPDALVSKVEEDAADGDGDGGVYRPPKMLPTSMEDFEEGGKSNKEKRKEKEARRRASRSALIKVREGFVVSFSRSGCVFFRVVVVVRRINLSKRRWPLCGQSSSFLVLEQTY